MFMFECFFFNLCSLFCGSVEPVPPSDEQGANYPIPRRSTQYVCEGPVVGQSLIGAEVRAVLTVEDDESGRFKHTLLHIPCGINSTTKLKTGANRNGKGDGGVVTVVFPSLNDVAGDDDEDDTPHEPVGRRSHKFEGGLASSQLSDIDRRSADTDADPATATATTATAISQSPSSQPKRRIRRRRSSLKTMNEQIAEYASVGEMILTQQSLVNGPDQRLAWFSVPASPDKLSLFQLRFVATSHQYALLQFDAKFDASEDSNVHQSAIGNRPVSWYLMDSLKSVTDVSAEFEHQTALQLVFQLDGSQTLATRNAEDVLTQTVVVCKPHKKLFPQRRTSWIMRMKANSSKGNSAASGLGGMDAQGTTNHVMELLQNWLWYDNDVEEVRQTRTDNLHNPCELYSLASDAPHLIVQDHFAVMATFNFAEQHDGSAQQQQETVDPRASFASIASIAGRARGSSSASTSSTFMRLKRRDTTTTRTAIATPTFSRWYGVMYLAASSPTASASASTPPPPDTKSGSVLYLPICPVRLKSIKVPLDNKTGKCNFPALRDAWTKPRGWHPSTLVLGVLLAPQTRTITSQHTANIFQPKETETNYTLSLCWHTMNALPKELKEARGDLRLVQPNRNTNTSHDSQDNQPKSAAKFPQHRLPQVFRDNLDYVLKLPNNLLRPLRRSATNVLQLGRYDAQFKPIREFDVQQKMEATSNRRTQLPTILSVQRLLDDDDLGLPMRKIKVRSSTQRDDFSRTSLLLSLYQPTNVPQRPITMSPSSREQQTPNVIDRLPAEYYVMSAMPTVDLVEGRGGSGSDDDDMWLRYVHFDFLHRSSDTLGGVLSQQQAATPSQRRTVSVDGGGAPFEAPLLQPYAIAHWLSSMDTHSSGGLMQAIRSGLLDLMQKLMSEFQPLMTGQELGRAHGTMTNQEHIHFLLPIAFSQVETMTQQPMVPLTPHDSVELYKHCSRTTKNILVQYKDSVYTLPLKWGTVFNLVRTTKWENIVQRNRTLDMVQQVLQLLAGPLSTAQQLLRQSQRNQTASRRLSMRTRHTLHATFPFDLWQRKHESIALSRQKRLSKDVNGFQTRKRRTLVDESTTTTPAASVVPSFIAPLMALDLLSADAVRDPRLKSIAVQWLDSIEPTSEQLMPWLPQLAQMLRFESYNLYNAEAESKKAQRFQQPSCYLFDTTTVCEGGCGGFSNININSNVKFNISVRQYSYESDSRHHRR